MTDIAIYRSTSPEPVTLTDVYEEDGRTWLQGRFSSDVEALYIVRVNGTASDLALLTSSRDIQIRVPEGVAGPYTASVRAVRRVEPGQRYLGALGFGYKTEVASPVEEALQRMTRFLMKSPGSDPWHPKDGGGLIRISKSLYQGEEQLLGAVDKACAKYNDRAADIAPRGKPNVTRVQATSVRVTTIENVRTVLGEDALRSVYDRERVLFISLQSRLFLPQGQSATFGSVITV